MERLRASLNFNSSGSVKQWTKLWTRSLTMTSSASSLPPAILCSRLKGASLLRCVLIGGLTTAEIARAFLVPEKTLGQRIFRAKRTLSEAHVPFEIPRADELRQQA